MGGSGSKANLLLLDDEESGRNDAQDEEPDFERITEDRVSNTAETNPFDMECNDITTKFFKTNKKVANMAPAKSFVQATGRTPGVGPEDIKKIKESKKS